MRGTSPHDGSPPRSRRPGNLPAEVNRFVGRVREVAEIGERLAGGRLVTVTGTGGVGKSRLALHAAARLQDRFSNGAWLVELSALRDGELLDNTVLEALGLATGAGRPPRAALVAELADREVLLVLDGCEHLVDACARLAAELLRRAPRLRVLATSRRPLEIAGETVLSLGPLPAPAPDEPEKGGERCDAVALFTDRARAVLPGFDPERIRPGAVAELCRRLDGIPLALELAAGRLRALTVEQLLQRLDDRYRLLTGSSRSALPRHRALRTAIGWSHELCTPAERLLWARLSVFAGDFDLDAVEYLCAGGGLEAEDVLGVLTELVNQSVVVREESGGRVRYRMLDTVREYGAGWLGEPEAEPLRRRHRDWYLGLATWCELDWFSPRQPEVARRVEEELPNLRLALEYCLQAPDEAHVGQYLAATLWFFWVGCGRLAEGQTWLERALALDGGQPEPRCKALWVAGTVAVTAGRPVAALGLLHECERLAESSGDDTAAAHTLQQLGNAAAISDDLERAVALLRDAVERFHRLGELDSLVVLAQVQLGQCLVFTGELDEAVALLREAHDIAEDAGERWAQSYAAYSWAYALLLRGDQAEALDLGLACLTDKRTLHDTVGITMALELIAALVVDRAPRLAARVQGAAASGWRSFGAERFGSWHFDGVHRECGHRARTALGDEAYDRELAEGGRLGLDVIAREALRECGAPDPPARCERAQRPGWRRLRGERQSSRLPATRWPGQRA